MTTSRTISRSRPRPPWRSRWRAPHSSTRRLQQAARPRRSHPQHRVMPHRRLRNARRTPLPRRMPTAGRSSRSTGSTPSAASSGTPASQTTASRGSSTSASTSRLPMGRLLRVAHGTRLHPPPPRDDDRRRLGRRHRVRLLACPPGSPHGRASRRIRDRDQLRRGALWPRPLLRAARRSLWLARHTTRHRSRSSALVRPPRDACSRPLAAARRVLEGRLGLEDDRRLP